MNKIQGGSLKRDYVVDFAQVQAMPYQKDVLAEKLRAARRPGKVTADSFGGHNGCHCVGTEKKDRYRCGAGPRSAWFFIFFSLSRFAGGARRFGTIPKRTRILR